VAINRDFTNNLFTVPAAAQKRYSVTALPNNFLPTGVNNRGQVSGFNNFSSHALLWEGGTTTDLGTLGGSLSVATAINDRGQVVGWSTTADGLQRSFLWEKGTMRQLGTDFVNSLSINNRGQVVVLGPGGTYLLTGSNATFIALTFNPAVVNQLGDVAGTDSTQHAFLWRHGLLTLLPTPGDFSDGRGINDSGDVVGVVIGATGHASLWTRGAVVDISGGNPTIALDINDAGVIVGVVGSHPALWMHGHLFDLNNLVRPRETPLTGTAIAISERGQIIISPGEIGQAFLLTPQ
jgi:probable HAF family extracellular repeat protein